MAGNEEQQIGYNLQRLTNASDPMFIQCVRVAYLNLKPNQVPDYYRILLNHFSHRLHTKTGNEILAGICNVLEMRDYSQVFVDNDFTKLLPFSQRQYESQLLDLLFILVQKVPKVFTDRVAAQVATLVEESPRKCLTLIAMYAQQFENVDDPLPIVDILFHQSECFRGLDCAEDYISLIVWLLRQCPQFKTGRFQHSWTYLCDMLTITNPVIINTIYSGLCAIFEIDPDTVKTYGYPSEAIACHIQHSSTQSSTLSLLLRYPPPPHSKCIEQIIITLTEIAKYDEKATLLLLGLAMEESNALILIQNPHWMINSLPKILDTLRLFGVVMLHDNLRVLIVQSPSTIGFFLNLLQVNSVGVCNAVCTIIKRLPLTPDFINRLSQSGFLAGYFGCAQEINDKSVRVSALRLIDTIAKIRFVSEFMDMIDLIIKLIKGGQDMMLPAAAVATRLVRYPKCARVFGQKKLNEYFMQPFTEPHMKKYAEKFLTVYNKINLAY